MDQVKARPRFAELIKSWFTHWVATALRTHKHKDEM